MEGPKGSDINNVNPARNLVVRGQWKDVETTIRDTDQLPPLAMSRSARARTPVRDIDTGRVSIEQGSWTKRERKRARERKIREGVNQGMFEASLLAR